MSQDAVLGYLAVATAARPMRNQRSVAGNLGLWLACTNRPFREPERTIRGAIKAFRLKYWLNWRQFVIFAKKARE